MVVPHRSQVGSGLSPPTRGSRGPDDALSDLQGSIPAHAGEPFWGCCEQWNEGVYPRPRGGAIFGILIAIVLSGLSPPTRGSHHNEVESLANLRSIPAHAGEPAIEDRVFVQAGVYPRPRGGAVFGRVAEALHLGLSPPTRGSPLSATVAGAVAGSIPAHAGEPSTPSRCYSPAMVYPRPRGGAGRAARGRTARHGLSPPTRGSLVPNVPLGAGGGSIPAHAGEPHCTVVWYFDRSVYPRPRGGAMYTTSSSASTWGLSPPTRGSLLALTYGAVPIGSIPAHAGEPSLCLDFLAGIGVYPRPRGGAKRGPGAAVLTQGLSPPTRGSRALNLKVTMHRRSIPAHAGEPTTPPVMKRQQRVYPRPRGGARPYPANERADRGLSPPTRGSRHAHGGNFLPQGSIPAHAGEP